MTQDPVLGRRVWSDRQLRQRLTEDEARAGQSGGGSSDWTVIEKAAGVVNAVDGNFVVFNGQASNPAGVTSGSPTLTGSGFTSALVGASVDDRWNDGYIDPGTTVLSVESPTSLTMSAPATGTDAADIVGFGLIVNLPAPTTGRRIGLLRMAVSYYEDGLGGSFEAVATTGTVLGAASISLPAQGAAVVLVADGTDWKTESRTSPFGAGSGLLSVVQVGGGATATGRYALAEGAAIASGSMAHAEAQGTAAGFGSHAEGGATASGSYAHAEGAATASSTFAHAEAQSVASGSESHAEGTATASGDWSHSEGGDGTTASGSYSHAEGQDCHASGWYSHAQGYCSDAFRAGEHAQSSGSFPSGGGEVPNQASWLTLATYTSDATQDTLRAGLSTTNEQLVLKDNTLSAITARLAARDDSGTKCAMWEIVALVDKQAGVVRVVGAPTITKLFGDADTSGWAVAFGTPVADVAIEVTGVAATTIHWNAVVEIVEVRF